MSIQVFLDEQDITGALNSQHALPGTVAAGIFPSKNRNDWWDLLPAISSNPTLKNDFFNDNNGVHILTIRDTAGQTFSVKVLLRMKYSARNR